MTICGLSEIDKVKLIERTCKYNAHTDILLWSGAYEGLPERMADPKSAVWFAAQKAWSHWMFLREQKWRYAYVDGFVLAAGYYEKHPYFQVGGPPQYKDRGDKL